MRNTLCTHLEFTMRDEWRRGRIEWRKYAKEKYSPASSFSRGLSSLVFLPNREEMENFTQYLIANTSLVAIVDEGKYRFAEWYFILLKNYHAYVRVRFTLGMGKIKHQNSGQKSAKLFVSELGLMGIVVKLIKGDWHFPSLSRMTWAYWGLELKTKLFIPSRDARERNGRTRDSETFYWHNKSWKLTRRADLHTRTNH